MRFIHPSTLIATIALASTIGLCGLAPISTVQNAPNFSALPSIEFVGIKDSDFESSYRPQQGMMLCWAAAAEMVLAYAGVSIPQAAIVERARGILIDAPGGALELFRATNGVFKTVEGKTAVVSGELVQGAPPPTVLYNQLKHGRPVIVSYQSPQTPGHVVVLTGIDVIFDPTRTNAEITIVGCHVFDPFAYRPAPPQPPNWGAPQLVFDQSLRCRHYAFGRGGPGTGEPFPGMITGAVMMDATLRE